MKVSVIVPLFYGKKYVDVIISMIAKNVDNMCSFACDETSAEIIFVNDSPNEKLDFLNRNFNERIHIECIINEKNVGIHQSRVNGLRKATGEYVLFLDQDDLIESNFFSEQLNVLINNKADWVVCNGIFRSNNLIFPNKKTVDILMSEKQFFESVNMIVSPGQTIIKRDVIPDLWKKEILNYNYCDDAYLWILLKDSQKKLAYTDLVLYRHVEHGLNASFSWMKNRSALVEYKEVIKRTACISFDNMKIYQSALDIEIERQSKFAKIDKKMSEVETNGIGNITDKIIIYGYGIFGRRLHCFFDSNDVDVDFIIDRSFQGLDNELRIYRIEELTYKIVSQHKDSVVCITLVEQTQEIEEKLYKLGFEKVMILENFLNLLLCAR